MPDEHYFSRFFLSPTIFLQNIFIPTSFSLRYAKPYMYLYHQPFAHTKPLILLVIRAHTISDWNALSSYVANTTSSVSFKNAFVSTLS